MINNKRRVEELDLLQKVLKLVKDSNKASYGFNISFWKKEWRDYLQLYDKNIERKAEYILYLRDQFSQKEYAADPQDQQHQKDLYRIKSLETELSLLHGAKIILKNMEKAYINESIQKYEQTLSLKKELDQMTKNFLTFYQADRMAAAREIGLIKTLQNITSKNSNSLAH